MKNIVLAFGMLVTSVCVNAQGSNVYVPAYRQAVPMAAYQACSGRLDGDNCSYSDIKLGLIHGKCEQQTLRPLPNITQDGFPQQSNQKSSLGPSFVCLTAEQQSNIGEITTLPASEPVAPASTDINQ